MSYDEREVRAQMLEQLADDVEGLDFEDFCLQRLTSDVGHREAFSEWLKFKAYHIRNPEPRRRRVTPRMPQTVVEAEGEQYKYPPDPHWGVDKHERFIYTDYDGESLIIWKPKEDDGSLWIDKGGQGPVFVRAEDVQVIVDGVWGRQK